MKNSAFTCQKLVWLLCLVLCCPSLLFCQEQRCWGFDTVGVLSSGACYDLSLKDDCVSSGFLASVENCSDTSRFCCYGPLFYGTPTAAPSNISLKCGVPFSLQSEALQTLAAASITIRSARQNRQDKENDANGILRRRKMKGEVELETEDCSMVEVFQAETFLTKGYLLNDQWILANISTTSRNTTPLTPNDFFVGIRPSLQSTDMLLFQAAEVQVYPNSDPLVTPTEDSWRWTLIQLVSAVEFGNSPDVCVACLPNVNKGRLTLLLANLSQDVVTWIRRTVGVVYSAPTTAPATVTPAPPTVNPFAVPRCNGKTDVLDIRVTTRGSFASHPNYPTLQTNPGVKRCRINMTTPAGTVLKLSLAMNTLVNCQYEHLTIFHTEADRRLLSSSICNPTLSSLPQKGPFCRVNGSVSFFTSTNYAVIEYCREDTANSVLQTAGFAVRWEVVNASTRPVAIPQIVPVAVTPGEPGNISTSADRWFLGSYANNLNVTFILTAPPGYFVRLCVIHSLEENSNCLADYLQITEGRFVHGRYCGANFTRVTSRSNNVNVTFVSDGAIQVGGFTLQYEASFCGEGFINCPMEPTRCLKPSQLCDGTVQCPAATDELPQFCGKRCGVQKSRSTLGHPATGEDQLIRSLIPLTYDPERTRTRKPSPGIGVQLIQSINVNLKSQWQVLLNQTINSRWLTGSAARLYLGLVYAYESIQGRSYVKPNSWPWQAALFNRKTGTLLCGGSLIQQRYVLTAAHCMLEVTNVNGDVKELRRRLPSDLIVVLGDHNIYSLLDQDKTEVRSVQYILVHPRFNLTNPEVPPFDFTADLAILRLSSTVSYRPEISPVCLPKVNEAPVPGSTCVVTGWGARLTKPSQIIYEPVRSKRQVSFDPTPVNSTVSYVLQQVAVPVLSQKECASQLSNSQAASVLKDDMVCAGGKQGICNGDSGGPLVCQSTPNGPWVLHGVTSWIDGCGMVNRPGVFIRVGRYIRWIEDIIRLLNSLP